MPYSYEEFKEDIKQHFIDFIPTSTKILDVGPGSGTYSHLLKSNGFSIDCIEIWKPYVSKFNLNNLYDKVFIGNILDFDISPYDYIIMGDVLEHLLSKEGQLLIRKLTELNKKCLVAVPYEYEQGGYGGNPYEIHLQSDLTPTIMRTRYPSLHLLYGDKKYGYYINYSF